MGSLKIAVTTAAIVCAAVVVTRASWQQAVDPAALPDGEGKVILFRACSDCHDLGQVVAKRLTPKQWKDVTGDMITRGVRAEDAEIATLVEFLALNVGHVNVNKATEAELEKYGGFSAAEAAAIVAARGAGKTFASVDDLKALPGIDGKTLDDRLDKIAFKDR
jgi:competence protein ComEA